MKLLVIIGCLVLLVSTKFTVSNADTSSEVNCVDVLKADIYVLCDSSGSIAPVGWSRAMNFIANLTRSFRLGADAVQLGFGIFSTTFVHKFDINEYTDHEQIAQVVLSTAQLKQGTQTAFALDEINNSGFLTSVNRGSRPGVDKYLLVITDGQSENSTKTLAAAERLRKQGIKIFCLGVGLTNGTEILGIAGNADNVFSVKSFGEIGKIGDQILQRVCTANQVTEPETECSPLLPADIIFALEVTSSTTNESFQRGIQIVINIVNSLTISHDATQVGFVIANKTWPQSGLSEDKDLILKELMETRLGRNVYHPLFLAARKHYESTYTRRVAKKILIYLTDSTYPDYFFSVLSGLWGQDAKNNLITIFTIGIKPGADNNQMKTLASKPEYSLPEDDFRALTNFIYNERTCLPDTPADIMIGFSFVQNADILSHHLQIVDKIIQNLKPSENGTRLSLLACNAEPAEPISLTGDMDLFYKNLGRLQYNQAKTCVIPIYQAALALYSDESARKYAKKILVYLVDRQSMSVQSDGPYARYAKENYETIIFTVGLQPEATEHELNALASRPEFNLPSDDLSALTEFISNLSKVKAH